MSTFLKRTMFIATVVMATQAATHSKSWAQCGNPLAGSCFVEHATPFCNNEACCDLVCACKPSCCTSAWTIDCAIGILEGCAASELCPPPDELCPPDIPGACGNSIVDYQTLIDSRLPPVSQWPMLGVPPGPDWLSSVNVNTVASSVMNTSPPYSNVVQGGCGNVVTMARDVAHTKFIKIDRNRGYVRYSDQNRLFYFNTLPHMAVSDSTAQSLAFQTFGALNLPFSEAGPVTISTVMGQDSSPMSGDTPPFEREKLVTAQRLVNGFPVIGSIARVAISNVGQHARLLVKWPRFQMPTSLALRSRSQVIADIAQRLMNAEQGATVRLGIQLAYAPAGANYLPVAVVTYDDFLSGQSELVPLVQVAPDQDWDGVSDMADNCIEDPNPCQEDLDMDGIGNRCDNCPTVSNASQLDSDQDGIGDGCDTPTGACCLTDGTCDGMTSALCSSLGGVYKGSNTTCLSDANANGIDDACECGLYGDVDGNGLVNLDDILCVLSGFGNPSLCSTGDIAPCDGNGIINLDDILAELVAYSGISQCSCP